MIDPDIQNTSEEIAIISLSGRFPGAKDVETFWQNLKAGEAAVTRFTDAELAASGMPQALLSDPAYVKARPVLDAVDLFDAAFFGVTPKDAELMDPQHRVFLECAWEVLERAGYDSETYPGSIGIFAGQSLNTYLLANLCANRETIEELVGAYQVGGYPTVLGNDKDYLTTRVAYKLNLRGPSMTVQTACSTSLVAVCQACQSLLTYQCDMALAGGVSISFPQTRGYLYQEGAMVSPDGVCRTFDADAQGTIFGAGAGVVLLKRFSDALADGDTVLAVIKGYALNNDGARKVSYMAPSVDGQAEVIAMAQAMAGVEADSLSYIEAHGTGTPLGDPIELAGLTQAFRETTDRKGFCAIGSVKTNVGHLEVAAGVTGLIKTVLALHHELLPPSLHYNQPNPRFDFANSPFYVNTELTAWKANGTPRRAGVSAFGVGGTNAHLIVEEAPALPPSDELDGPQVLVLSAKSETALETMTQNLAAHLQQNSDLNLADAAYTLQTGRQAFAHRRVLVCRNREDALDALESLDKKRAFTGQTEANGKSVAFLFPGQGSQAVGMAAELYRSDAGFRETVDSCADTLLSELGLDICTVLYTDEADREAAQERLNQTSLTQPVLFVIEYALARWWQAQGVQPKVMLGHSIGEYVAACLAGVFTAEDALRLLAARGRLVQQLPGGVMLAVRASEADVRPLLTSEICLAAVNSPTSCTLSGPSEAMEAVQATLSAQGIASRRLKTSHAFHSSMLEPCLAEFAALLQTISLHNPTLPYISNVTGTWITPEEATSPDYWVRHLRETVRFADGVQLLLADPELVLLEVGPGRTLTALAAQQGRAVRENTVLASLGREPEETALICLREAQGRLWLAGAAIDWTPLHDGESRRRILLPTYPFERKRYWREPTLSGANLAARENSVSQTAVASCEPVITANAIADFRPAAQEVPTENSVVQEREMAAKNPDVLETESPVSPAGSGRSDRLAARVKSLLQEASGMDLQACGMADSFLEMGFDSLFLTQACLLFQKEFAVKTTFRQLMGDLSTLGALAAHIDRNLPPDALPASVPVPAAAEVLPPASVPNSQNAPLPTQTLPSALPLMPPLPVGTIPASASGLEAIVQQQLLLMSRQLDLLRSGEAAVVPAEPAKVENNVPAMPAPAPLVNMPVKSAEKVQAEREAADFKAFGPYKPINKTRTGGLTAEQQNYIDALVKRYNQAHPESKRLAQLHRPHHADPRAVSGFRVEWKEMVYPLTVERSSGSKLWDVDGNEYVDMLNGFGVTLFGHAPQFVTDAVAQQLNSGFEIGPQTPLAGKVAELICEFTGMERACFCNTGSEAVMAAMRLARTVTGRDKIVLFTGAYHGNFDEVLVRANPGQGATHAFPIAPGIPAGNVENVIVLEYGTDESLEFLKANAGDLAAVLVETVQSRHPDLQPKAFLTEVRRITKESETALIFDEVVTGFRVHPGGVQALFGIRADMATYGKVIGGGLPIGVLAGSKTFMDALDGGMWQYGDDSFPEVGVTFHAGTFVRHPMVMAATWAVLNHLKAEGPALQARLNERTSQFAAAINVHFTETGVPTRIRNFGSVLFFNFPGDLRYASLFHYGLRLRGINIYEGFPFFLTTAHTDADLEKVITAFKEAAAELQAVGLLPGKTSGSGEELPTHRNGHSKNGTAPESLPALSEVPAATAKEPILLAPLTEAQREIWLSAQMSDEASCAYNESCTLTLHGSLDREALYTAVQKLLARHEALRTTFQPDGDFQNFVPVLTLAIPLTDLSALEAGEQEAQIKALIAADAGQPFDLLNGPPVRFQLLKLAPDVHQVLFTAHHIVCDGWSIGVLFDELSRLYTAEVRGTDAELEAAISFGEYALLAAQEQQSPEAATAGAYWRSRFETPVPVLDLPTDRPRPALKSFPGSMERRTIGSDLLQEVKRVSAKRGTTLFSTLLAAFHVLLSRLAGQNDLVIGIPAAGQSLLGSPNLVGHCLNFLPVRSEIADGAAFAEFAALMQNQVLDAYDNQNYTYGTLIRALNLPRDASRLPLLSVMFNIDPGSMDRLQFAGLECEVTNNPKHFVNMDMFLNIYKAENELRLECDYNTDLFDQATIQRLLGHYETLLQGIVADCEQPISQLPLLTAAERDQMLVEWNATKQDFPPACLHELVAEQAARTPDALAAVCDHQTLTYARLDAQADQLAHSLRQQGVGSETLVALCLERSLSMLVGVLGILKAGGAYVPLDPAYPPQRQAAILTDSRASLLLTQRSLLAHLPPYTGTVRCLDDPAWQQERSVAPSPQSGVAPAVAQPDQLAYLIYTSGSTGQPKGVAIEHHSAVTLVHWARQIYSPEELAGVLFSTSLCFDLSIFELFVPLSMGGCVVIAQNALHLPTLPAAPQVTLVNTVPSVMTELLRSGPLPASVRTVNLAGEPLPTSLVNQLYALPSVERVFDLYGPTEDTTYSTWELRQPDAPATIGRPVANTQAYVLDKGQQPVPIGVAGELYLGGDGLARGYLHDAERTAQKFVSHPFAPTPGARLYRTGDLVKWRTDGRLEYLGRLDHQVKVRGFRIELGEIETRLREHEAVAEAVVVVREDVPGEKRLVAYIVPDGANADGTTSPEPDSTPDVSTDYWKKHWNMLYGVAKDELADPALAGQHVDAVINRWTGQEDAQEQADEWIERTVERIALLRPERVLEVGCGGGQLLLRIAPQCREYRATDLSAAALDILRQQLAGQSLPQVSLSEQPADDFTGIPDAAFDTVIINSVAQYFPDADYLVRVLKNALKAVMPGGRVFLGDVQSYALLETFHAAAQLKNGNPDLPIAAFVQRVQARMEKENELTVDPEFFFLLQQQWAEIGQVEIQLRRGRIDNETTEYHYDVTLHVGEGVRALPVSDWIHWNEAGMTPAELERILREKRPATLGLRQIPNARLHKPARLMTMLADEACPGTVGELRAALEHLPPAIHPEDLWTLAEKLGYLADLRWAGSGKSGHCDAAFRLPAGEAEGRTVPVFPDEVHVGGRLADYTNRPGQSKNAQEIVPILRNALQKTLPEYMVPAAFVLLDTIPLTPNGKIDRKALPAPDWTSTAPTTSYVAPRNPQEEALAGIWAEVLRLKQVGVQDNIFELGGDSLLIFQITTRAREAGLALTPRDFFQHQTINDLVEATHNRDRQEIPVQKPAISRLSRDAHRMRRSSLS